MSERYGRFKWEVGEKKPIPQAKALFPGTPALTQRVSQTAIDSSENLSECRLL